MNSFHVAHKGFWNANRRHSLYFSLLFLALAFVIQISAGHYSARQVQDANFVGDIFLDNLPVLDFDYVIVQGAIIMYLIGIVLFAYSPRELLFGIKAVALFVIIRSFFIDLTHIGIYPESDFLVHGLGSRAYNSFNFSGNFFFSGHTGLPFLLALIFWRQKFWRIFFFCISAFFGMSVLLAHVHYSIDVFAAPFITYSIFVMTAKLFPHDYAILTGET